MKGGRSGHLKHALTVNGDRLKDLGRALSPHFDEIEFELQFKSKRSVTVSLDRIASEKIRSSDPLRRVWVRGNASNPYRSLSISIDDHWSQSIWIDLSGPKSTAEAINRKIEEWLDSSKPWYAAAAVLSPLSVVLSLLPMAVGYLVLIPFFRENFGISLWLAPSLPLASLLAWALLRKVCPAVEFSFNSTKSEAMEKVRWTVIIGFVVSLAAGIVAAILLAI